MGKDIESVESRGTEIKTLKRVPEDERMKLQKQLEKERSNYRSHTRNSKLRIR